MSAPSPQDAEGGANGCDAMRSGGTLVDLTKMVLQVASIGCCCSAKACVAPRLSVNVSVASCFLLRPKPTDAHGSPESPDHPESNGMRTTVSFDFGGLDGDDVDLAGAFTRLLQWVVDQQQPQQTAEDGDISVRYEVTVLSAPALSSTALARLARAHASWPAVRQHTSAVASALQRAVYLSRTPSPCVRCRGRAVFPDAADADARGVCPQCRRIAASMIVRRVRSAFSDPTHAFCVRRLLREFSDLTSA